MSAVSAMRRLNFSTPLLLLSAAGAWAGVIAMAGGMGSMPGTMGLSIGSFTGMWVLMMAAMMLPSIVPFAALYTRTFQENRGSRLAALAGGYLIIWTLPALPIYVLAWGVERAAVTHPAVSTALTMMTLTACGLYQLTSLKDRCLAHCRSPLGDAFKYAAYDGRLRDLRVGISHGLYCLGCCWALMALLLSFGLMNVQAMVVLTAVVLVEKFWSHGPLFGRLVGVAALFMALVLVVRPELAPWLGGRP